MDPAAIADEIAGWLTVLSLLLLPGLIATVLWSPTLASARLRFLFRHLPPSGSTVGSYVLTAVTLSVPWLVGLGRAFHEIGSQAEPQGEVFLSTATLVAVGFVVCLPPVAALGLPRFGIDWDPTGYGLGTWALLLVSSVWYSAIFLVPMFLFGIAIELPF